MRVPEEARGSRASAIALSIVLHVAVIMAFRHYVWTPAAERDVPVFQVFNLDLLPRAHPVPIAPPPVAQAEPPQPQPQPQPLAPEPIAPRDDDEQLDAAPLTQPSEIPAGVPAPGAAVGVPDGNAPRSTAERLQRRMVDPALWVGPATQFGAPPTPAEKAEGRLAAGMRAYNDSVASGLADAERATDWTVKDKNGGRWGVSPGQIHIGGVTLPLPFGVRSPDGRREDAADKARTYAETNAQVKRLELEATFESRAKALRARKDAARDSARAARAGAGGG